MENTEREIRRHEDLVNKEPVSKKRLEVLVAPLKLHHQCGSRAAAAYITALNDGCSVKLARLYGERARIQERIDDVSNGRPDLAAGIFTDVVEKDWDITKESCPSEDMCEYISSSRTRYLVYREKILARIADENTATEWAGLRVGDHTYTEEGDLM